MMGEDNAEDTSPNSFNSKSVWARMSVIVGGPVFNLILAWIFCMIIIGVAGYHPPVVAEVLDGSSAQEQGLREGDVIKEINGRSVHIWDDINLYTLTHAKDVPFEIVYERDGEEYTAEVEPRVLDESGSKLLGVVSGEIEKPGFAGTMKYGFYQLEYWVRYTVDSLRMLVTGQAGLRDLSGPVGIVTVVSDVYETAAPAGAAAIILSMMNFGTLLTANLGIMNLLPLPALDGGRLVFLILEAVRKKRVPPEKEGMVHFAGFAALMILMVIVMYNDIMKLF